MGLVLQMRLMDSAPFRDEKNTQPRLSLCLPRFPKSDPSLAGLCHPHIVDDMMQRERGLGRRLPGPWTTHRRVEYHITLRGYKQRLCTISSPSSACSSFLFCANGMTELGTDERQVYEVGNVCDPGLIHREVFLTCLGILTFLAAVIGASKVVCCDREESSEAEYTRENDSL